MLSIKKGKIQYDENVILEDVYIDISTGTMSFLIGPNGAGKTSLINILAGNRKLTSGTVTNNFKKSILIPQKTSFPPGVNLFDYLSSVYYQSGWKWYLTKKEEEKISNVIQKLGLEDKTNLYMDKLSGGEQQLANIGLCLLSGADLLLLDEPSSNLDIINQVRILEILKGLNLKGITIIVIMHDINLAAKFGDHFIIVNRDANVVSGNREDTLTKENLSRAYNYEFKVVDIDEELFIQPHNNNGHISDQRV